MGFDSYVVPVEVAAKLLCMSAEVLRNALKLERVPIGFAVQCDKGWTYKIIPKQFCDYTGISNDKLRDLCDEYRADRVKYMRARKNGTLN
jgi:hypothetical protein